ncbi:putative RING-H2 finger protein ATL53 [Platanthera guangdongensis]|uniref:RING-H2 finger protein ATL53 n=1 Tax=Platanthera guangdongensis TaxID=2320717 RepID=A0ABR2LZF8_9ASPA
MSSVDEENGSTDSSGSSSASSSFSSSESSKTRSSSQSSIEDGGSVRYHPSTGGVIMRTEFVVMLVDFTVGIFLLRCLLLAVCWAWIRSFFSNVNEVMERELRALPPNVFDNTVAVDDDCSICLGEFEQGDAIRILPSCRHILHVTCVDGWLRVSLAPGFAIPLLLLLFAVCDLFAALPILVTEFFAISVHPVCEIFLAAWISLPTDRQGGITDLVADPAFPVVADLRLQIGIRRRR